MGRVGIICATVGLIFMAACASPGNITFTDCDCYKINGISEESFILSDDETIVPVELGCKNGYFIKKIKMQPQAKPKDFSQYIILNEIECCRICQEEEE